MTLKIITLTAACALTLGGLSYLKGQEFQHHGPGPGQHMENPLEKISETLSLTPEQKAKVQPIVDQAKPQIVAIHQEAMEKMKAVMESCGAQIRPLLTPEQQQKFDALKKAHEDMHRAMQELHEAQKK